MRARLLPFVLAFAVATLWIALPISRGGAWDPYELDAADLARRVAVHAFGARDLARAGDPPEIPTLSDLGMGELPFTSMAVAFGAFGVSDVAGRGTMAAWAVLGAMCLFVLVRRAADTKAAFFAVLVLVTMPLYALHGRTMLGDAVTLAAFISAVTGLLLGVIGRGRARVGWLLLGAFGLLAGFLSRGLLFGVTAPCVSVGASLLLGGGLLAAEHRRPRLEIGLAVALLVAGAVAAARFCAVALPLVDTDAPLDREVGMILWDPAPNDSTFDRLLRQIGHALFPWSALLPWALGRAVAAAPPAPGPPGAPAGPFLRVALLVTAVVAFACGTLAVPWAGPMPYLGVAPLAGLLALALRDLDLERTRSPVAVLSVGLTFALLVVDFSRDPSRSLAPFSIASSVLPPGYEEDAKRALLVVTALAAPAALLGIGGWRDDQPQTVAAVGPFVRARAREARLFLGDLGRATIAAFQGNLVFFLVVFEAGLVGLAAMLFIGRRAEWASIAELPHAVVEVGSTLWWALPLGLVFTAAGVAAARTAWEVSVGLSRLGRGGLLGVLLTVAGSVLGFSFYPALAAELSPKEVFETFRALRAPDEELGLLGASPRAGAFYAERAVPSFPDEKSAFAWLDAPETPRRFLVVKARDLARLNSMWRGAHGANLPVLDARRTDSLLAVSRLEGADNQNPLSDIVLEREPAPAWPLATRFLDHLDVLGWQIEDAEGRVVESVPPGGSFRLVFFYRVLAELGDWHAFVHLDGRTRHNADHVPLAGRYPMPLWRPGDLVRDETLVTLPPNLGPGEVWVFFGFFQGKTRLRVTEGEHRDNRAVAGRIRVR